MISISFSLIIICFLIADMIPARVVLYMLSFSGFLVSFMMRTDINIAMVAMAKIPSLNNETIAVSSHCYIMSNVSHVENNTIIRPEVRLRNYGDNAINYIVHFFLSQIIRCTRYLKNDNLFSTDL